LGITIIFDTLLVQAKGRKLIFTQVKPKGMLLKSSTQNHHI